MIEIPKRIQNLTPYKAGKTIAEVKETYNIGTISKLASNENRLGCSPAVMPAIEKAMAEIQDYPDPVARKLTAELADRNNVSENEIIVASGSESILSILCRSLLSHENNIVTSKATFVGIFVQGGVMGANFKKIPATSGYGFNTSGMLDAIDENTKMVYIANPNNPTGTYIRKDEYEEFINHVPERVLVIADEAYFEYARDVNDYPQAIDYRRDNVIITRTFSKAYGLAGFRIGYAIAHPELIEQLMKCKLTFEPTTLAQAAALAAVQDEDFLDKSISVVNQEREKLCLFFDEHSVEYVPSISNSVMMICETLQDATEFTQRMLEHGVILRQLKAFGLPHCVRITIGTSQEMTHFRDTFKVTQKK